METTHVAKVAIVMSTLLYELDDLDERVLFLKKVGSVNMHISARFSSNAWPSRAPWTEGGRETGEVAYTI